MDSIDLIGVPILVQGEKLLRHIKSIDVPVKRYYIVDNSEGNDSSVEEAIDQICDDHVADKYPNIEQVVVVQNNQNAGYPGSVNQIIRDNTDCDHWVVTGFDWWPKPHEYKKLAARINSLKDGAFLGSGMDAMCGFVFTPSLLEGVGFLDENFFPGYFEDNDYRRRIQLHAGSYPTLRVESFPLTADHDRSSTLNSSDQFKKRNQYTFQKNYEYYLSKWGGAPNNEIYVKPFNLPVGLDYWRFDPKRREEMRW